MPSQPRQSPQALATPALRRPGRPPLPQPPQERLPQARQIADRTRCRILDLSSLALRAQANSLPKLASLLLAGSQPDRQ